MTTDANSMSEPRTARTARAGRRTLVVVVPSIRDDFTNWSDLLTRLQQLPGLTEYACDWALVHHGASRFAFGPADRLSREVAAKVHERWTASGGYERVILVGHSIGGLLVRDAYVRALGAFAADERQPWADAVDRLVLFASLSRGLPATASRRWWLPAAAWASRVVPLMHRWIVRDLLRGSEFVANLRITWIRTMNALDRPPDVVQFLGSRDDLVHADDSRDLEAFPNGRREEVAGASHADVIRLDTADDPDARFALIASAFTAPRLPAPERPADGADGRVVIVLHGIRASNRTWVADLCEHIRTTWPGTVVIPATYGRFSARKFALPPTRRRYLAWLQDTYAECLAANPRAAFHFIGHSNGTYLLGHSLDRLAAMRFERLYLAGSVLPTT